MNAAQKRILVPTRCVHDWKNLLAEPEKHWKPGYSAMATAYSWEKANGLPREIKSLFIKCPDPSFHKLELALSIPEYKVPLKGGSRPSQNDVFALLRSDNALIAVTVEGKAREDFDKNLGQWHQKTSERGYQTRLQFILEQIGLDLPIPDSIRYQLLHRTASAVIEAKRFHARCAVMIVQSFVAADRDNHYGDYRAFLSLYGVKSDKDKLIFLRDVNGIRLFSAWVQSEPLTIENI